MADFEFDVEPIRSLAQAGARAAHGLPPDEVRRLGARRRKRRLTVTASVAVVAAMALAGGAAAMVEYVGSGSNLEPAGPAPLPEVTTVVTTPGQPSPTPDAPDDGEPATDESPDPSSIELPGGIIPGDFPIDVDLPDYGGEGQTEGPEVGYWYKEISPCAAESFPAEIADALMDAMWVRLVAPEVEVFRGLWVFESVADAESVMKAYVDDVSACPSVTQDTTMTTFSAERLDLGDDSHLTVQSLATLPDENPVPGLTQSALVRLGSALLLVSDSGEGMRDTDSERLQRESVLEIAGVLAAETCETLDNSC